MPPVSRRGVLALLAGTAAGSAGCLGARTREVEVSIQNDDDRRHSVDFAVAFAGREARSGSVDLPAGGARRLDDPLDHPRDGYPVTVTAALDTGAERSLRVERSDLGEDSDLGVLTVTVETTGELDLGYVVLT